MNNNKANCLFCEKTRLEGSIQYPQLLRTVSIYVSQALYLKYNAAEEQPLEDILKHAHKKWVIDFFEKALEVNDEFLKKRYSNPEIYSKLVDLTEYYKYRLDTPYMYMLPLSKLLSNYNKQRKDYHYTSIKYRLGILTPSPPPKSEIPPYSQMLQITSNEDQQDSLISLVQKLSCPTIKNKVYTQPNLTASKLYTQPKLIKQSEQVSRKLKAILKNDVKPLVQYNSKFKIIQSKSQSNVKFNTLHSSNVYGPTKKLSIQQPLMKTTSQADIISSIYLQKSNVRKQKKLMQIFYK